MLINTNHLDNNMVFKDFQQLKSLDRTNDRQAIIKVDEQPMLLSTKLLVNYEPLLMNVWANEEVAAAVEVAVVVAVAQKMLLN